MLAITQLRHVVEVHPVHAAAHRRHGHDRGPGRDLAHVLVLGDRHLGEMGLQDRVQQLVEGRYLFGGPQKVVGDVPEVRLYLRRHHLEGAARELLYRPGERHHGPLQLEQLALELVDPARVGARPVLGEHIRLDLVDVRLDGVDHGEIVVHHVVGDRVQHGGRALGELPRVRLQTLAHRAERAVPPVPHGDDEVPADEHHDLAGVDDLAGRGQLRVLHVTDGLEHGEQRLPVPLDLRPLVRVHRVLDRQRVQVEQLGDVRELQLGRLVQPQPDEAVVGLADPVDRVHQIAPGLLADPVPVRHALDDRRTQRRAGGVAEVDAGVPPRQARHSSQASGLAQVGHLPEISDLPQVACHRHAGLLARLDVVFR
jgi:hypothetical protein